MESPDRIDGYAEPDPRQGRRDLATGRPLRDVTELTDDELATELLVAAMAPGRLRLERFEGLRAERDRRAG
jgi:hypothetical protein